MSYLASIANTLEQTGEWRLECAQRYPDDAERNYDAAKLCNALAAQFSAGDIEGDLIAKYASLMEDENHDVVLCVTEAEREIIRRIGFHEFPKKADDLLDRILSRVCSFDEADAA